MNNAGKCSAYHEGHLVVGLNGKRAGTREVLPDECSTSPQLKFFFDFRNGGGTNVANKLIESPRTGASWSGCSNDSSISTGAATPPRCRRLPSRRTTGDAVGSTLFLENILLGACNLPSESYSESLSTSAVRWRRVGAGRGWAGAVALEQDTLAWQRSL